MTHECRDCVYVERVYTPERWHDIKYEYVVLCYHERLHGVLEKYSRSFANTDIVRSITNMNTT